MKISDLPGANDFFECCAEPCCMLSFDGVFRSANRAFAERFGWEQDELKGRTFVSFAHPDGRSKARLSLQTWKTDSSSFLEHRFRCADGHFSYMHWHATAVSSSQLLYLVGHDVTELKSKLEWKEQSLAQLRRLATTDELTRVHNRRSLMARIRAELQRGRRNQSPVSVVMVDVDKFKQFNDNFGHLAGDRVLMAVAGILLEKCRDTDVIGRYGGEEFLLVLPDTNQEGALIHTGRLNEAIAAHRWRHGAVTASFGVTTVQPDWAFSDGVDGVVEHAIETADSAMYVAKEAGRNRVCVG